ncbi:unnamed protein product [Adineta ricciae]|uniref:Uncharacterized protein n=1 Tax=Adineta ricciae TaxID=249248 RepID=A0A814PGG2_ADIRI|nr:unnamed protein product [Adineta ricciae]
MSASAVVFPPSLNSNVYVAYRQRFYILGVFSFLAFNQCAFWLTFSPISPSTQTYYGIPSATVDLLLNWGPIIFIPCLPFVYLLLNRKNGLRYTVLILSIACFLATFLRIIPSLVTSPSSPHFKSISLPFIHAGQIINAACGPLVMAPVSQLSCLWFSPNERTRATTMAIMANIFGGTISFLINPAIVSHPSKIPHLLYFHLGLASLAGLLAIIHFPSQPPTPPSAAGELLMNENSEISSLKAYKDGFIQCMTNLSFVLLSTAGGVLSGTFAVWTSLFSSILAPEHYSETQAGWFGFAASLAGILGALCLSALVDRPRFRRSLKLFMLICFIGCFLSVLCFQFCVRTVFSDKPLVSSASILIGFSLSFAGLFQGASSPLVYESAAEIMFPLPESLSASILVQWNNIACVILLFVASQKYKLVNLLVLIVIAVAILMISFARVTYKRQDEDSRKTAAIAVQSFDLDSQVPE